MSPTEFAFLALGLVLGIAVGAAVAEVFRARPAPRREVRLTVSPNSIAPRRPSTLASEAREASHPPASGGPAADLAPDPRDDPAPDGAGSGLAAPGIAMAHRTLVPSRVVAAARTPAGMPVFQASPRTPSSAPQPAPAPSGSAAPGPSPRAALLTLDPPAVPAAPVAGVVEPLVLEPPPPSTSDVGAYAGERAVRVRPAREAAPERGLPASVVGVTVATAEPGRAAPDDAEGIAGGPVDQGTVESGPCAGPRRVAAERCELAVRARHQAAAVADVLHQARRSYDILRERVDRQERLADPREVRAAKDLAHRTFRDARAAAMTTEAAEAAARDWLADINRINMAARAAVDGLVADRQELTVAVPRLERLAVEADAARITAETAEAGCREAREALAACEEQAAAPPPTPDAEPEPEPEPGMPAGWPPDPDPSLPGVPAGSGGSVNPAEGVARVLRVLRGDRAARETLVAQLSGTDGEEARRWRLALADLVDAIVARAIEDGYLEVDESDTFWGMFDTRERRDIVSALSALGFRFDGLGGFADGRVPAQRDLSLAVGYAGLDRMRIRQWPRESDLAGLFAGAAVAADEWLAAEGGDLALGRMIDALGNRAGDLADVWNAWGRVRPLLLATD